MYLQVSILRDILHETYPILLLVPSSMKLRNFQKHIILANWSDEFFSVYSSCIPHLVFPISECSVFSIWLDFCFSRKNV